MWLYVCSTQRPASSPAVVVAQERRMLMIPVTAFFIGVFALIQVPLTVMVGYRRAQTGIQCFDGGDQTLLRRMRAHANYTETVPIVLLAMAAAELSALPHRALWA